MRTGDLVKHAPSKNSIVAKLYNDWGHDRDFNIGIVVETKESFVLVMPSDTKFKPKWYEHKELEVVSERK